MNIRTENWNGYKIRFIEKEPGSWWGVTADVAKALHYKHSPHMIRMLSNNQKDVHVVDTPGGAQEMSIVSELGIYAIIMRSRRKEAIQFQEWVYKVIQSLRQATGLEGFQVFRLLDREHQREAMSRLKQGLAQPVRVDFIKANTISNKAVSSMFGYPKMLKKGEMSPDMLVQRQQILDDTVSLMSLKEKFGLDLAISKTVYDKYLS